MDLFLKILGGCFLAILIFGVVGTIIVRLLVRRALKHAIQIGGEAFSSTPSVIRLSRQTASWQDEVQVRSITNDLLLLGFRQIGDFATDKLPVTLRALVKEQDAVYAVVYEHALGMVWCDLWQRYEDGSTLTVTNAPEGEDVEAPAYASKVYLREASVSEMWQRFGDARKDAPIPADAEGFEETFEREFQRSMEWRAQRGGTTEEEIRRIAARDGTEVDPEMMQQLMNHSRREASAQLSELVLQRFLESGSVTAAQWDEWQDDAFVVHDQMPHVVLLDLLEDVLDQEVEDDEDLRWAVPEALSGLEKWDVLLGRTTNVPRLSQMWETESPVKARVYRVLFS